MIRKSLASRNAPRPPSRSRDRSRKVLACAAIVLAAGVFSSARGAVESANAASKRVPNCSTFDVKEHVSTSKRTYASGAKVVMTSSVRNASTKTCAVEVGPTSPSLTVTDSKGVVVWNNCFTKDRPGVCSLSLESHALKPGATYAKTFAWDQRSSPPPPRVPRGTYTLTARFNVVSGNHKTKFYLTKVAYVSSGG